MTTFISTGYRRPETVAATEPPPTRGCSSSSRWPARACSCCWVARRTSGATCWPPSRPWSTSAVGAAIAAQMWNALQAMLLAETLFT